MVNRDERWYAWNENDAVLLLNITQLNFLYPTVCKAAH